MVLHGRRVPRRLQHEIQCNRRPRPLRRDQHEPMFESASAFNGDISGWDVSSVEGMSFMFRGASAFNQPLGSWAVSAVTDMSYMFDGASAFNQPLGSWNVSSVENMSFMFRGASAFNQVTPGRLCRDRHVLHVRRRLRLQPTPRERLVGRKHAFMFRGASPSSTAPRLLDVSAVTDMFYMFDGASAFNQPLDSWNVSSVTNALHVHGGNPSAPGTLVDHHVLHVQRRRLVRAEPRGVVRGDRRHLTMATDIACRHHYIGAEYHTSDGIGTS